MLEPGGLLVFDDLIKPKPDISANSRRYVYDRLLFDTDFSFTGYQEALGKTGFQVLEAHDLSDHLGRSYRCLSGMALEKKESDSETFQALSYAYDQMVQAVIDGELGWGLYLCRK